MNFAALLSFCILNFLPLAIVFNVENAQVVPELEPGNGVRDESLSKLVLRVTQGILRIHLIQSLGTPKFGQQILLLDAPLRELYPDLADRIIALGLVERAPTVPHLELDVVLLL